MKKKKISLIGAGNIGSTIAHIIVLKKLSNEIVLLDIKHELSKAKALDIIESSSTENFNIKIIGTNKYEYIKNSDVIIISAGISRKPGMNRNDLLKTNAKIMNEIGINIKKYCSNAFIIVVTNPLDIMVSIVQKSSNIPTNMIVGMSGVLDSSRFRYFLANELDISTENISTFIIGEHNDNMLPLINYTSISGIPLTKIIDMGLITKEKVNEIVKRTRNSGKEIVDLLKSGSAYYAPASSTVCVLESYLNDKRNVLSCSAYLNGEYGVKDLFIGVPVIIGNLGVRKILEIKMKTNEQKIFNKSVKSLKNLINSLNL